MGVCSVCRGVGTIQCPTCEVTKLINTTLPETDGGNQDCEECNGAGEISCRNCEGSGEIG
jgi:RecJ-like exonuclease